MHNNSPVRLAAPPPNQTDAVIPGASVTIVNDATGDKGDTKADSAGFFSVTALQPGTYMVTISSKGFAAWKETGVLVNQGDSLGVPNIHLKISSDATAVTVISGQDAEGPVDSAEVSATLNNELVDSAVLTGRNAAELIKMTPGVVFNNGGGSGSAYNRQVTGTNNGPVGNFSADGTQPNRSTDVYLDGANLIDPGNAGTQGPNIWPYMRNPHYWGSDLAVFKAFKVTEAQRIEVRISATNWLNHPYAAFNLSGTNSDDKPIFNGYSSSSGMITNSNPSTTGTPIAKVGYRWMQFAAKYYF